MSILDSRLGRRRKTTLATLFAVTSLAAGALLSACGGETPATPTAGSGADAGSGIERGKVVFMRYCNACHPGGGRGAGPSLIEEASRTGDARLRSVVRNGEKRMPAFGPEQIADNALTDLVAYVRTLK